MKKSYHLFISPHLDDVIFSLGSYIKNLNKPSIIVTLFTKTNNTILKTLKGDYYLYGDYETRISEDYQVIKNLDKSIIIYHLNFPEALFRKDTSNLNTSIITKINTIINKYNVKTIYFPLGIGCHPDHKIAYNLNHYYTKKYSIKFYFDYPYATMRLAENARLSQLGIFNKVGFSDILLFYRNPINQSCPILIRLFNIIYFVFSIGFNFIRYLFKTTQTYHLDIYQIDADQKFITMKGYKTQINPIFGSVSNLYTTLANYPCEKIIEFKDNK